MNLLQEWFGEAANEERRISIFTLPDSRVRWFTDVEAAREYAESSKTDTYFGVGLMRPVPSGRGGNEDCVGIGGLWVDLDWRSTKPDKPLGGNPETALAFIRSWPIQPSVIVDSGGGFHAYWIFKEPWLFDDESERLRAASLANGWHAWINRQAPKWQLENCGDLARILRVPGTLNHKYGDPVRCSLHTETDRRFVPDDFDDFASSPSVQLNGKREKNLPKATDAAEKFEILCLENAVFRDSFDHTRSDLLDISPSGIDLSLSTIAAANGWDDGELIWLIGHHRNRWGDNPQKAARADYLERTISKARASAKEMTADHGVDLSEILPAAEPAIEPDFSGILNQCEETTLHTDDPGTTPHALLRVPGFISELMDHTLATAPYPNEVLAFTGALAMQSLLSARRVRDEMNNRTNLYLLALAKSGSGKDWPRKINVRLAFEANIINQIGDRFASGEGLEDALAKQPAMLFQTDEIDGLLQTINTKDGRAESIMTAMLNFYGQSNAIYRTRQRAGKEGAGQVIVDPSLTIFGTAVPRHYFDAVSDKMLTNGFFARVLSFDAEDRGSGRDAIHLPLPQRLIDSARAWQSFGADRGNLVSQYPDPPTIEPTDDARRILAECRDYSDAEYKKAAERDNDALAAIWARTWERARKLALLYSCSANTLDSLHIDASAARWGADLSIHQTKRTIHLIETHRADGEFAVKAKRLLAVLRQWHTDHGDLSWMHFRIIGVKLRWSPREHDEVRQSLLDTEQIEVRTVATGKRARREYRLTKNELSAIKREV